jgi:DNA-binding MarR family transcriptional regulator
MDDQTLKNTKRISRINSQDTTDRVKSGSKYEADAKQLFFSLISRLSRLQDFYTKKFFEGLPLNNLLEFNFLFYINKNASIRKKEIIDYHHVEYTTGIDIIKRLIKLLLVSESKDQLDKRSKRLKITSEGKRVLMEALIRINKITHVFFEILENENWMGCMKVLSALEDYHKKIFAKSNTNTSYELLNTINSTHIGA